MSIWLACPSCPVRHRWEEFKEQRATEDQEQRQQLLASLQSRRPRQPRAPSLSSPSWRSCCSIFSLLPGALMHSSLPAAFECRAEQYAQVRRPLLVDDQSDARAATVGSHRGWPSEIGPHRATRRLQPRKSAVTEERNADAIPCASSPCAEKMDDANDEKNAPDSQQNRRGA